MASFTNLALLHLELRATHTFGKGWITANPYAELGTETGLPLLQCEV